MSSTTRSRLRARLGLLLMVSLVWALQPILTASAATLVLVSTDPYTNTTSSHKTEVEPDTFSFGSTIVSAFQVGRFSDGGASNIGWATSKDGGATWTNGFLPGITKFQGAGPYDRVSDPTVAYDPAHNVWLISSLPLLESGGVHGAAVVVSRSTDGGTTWSNPVTIATGSDLDKNWTVCDTTFTSPFYGRCYTEWDDHGNSNRIKMSTSTNGGTSWGAALNTANNATGIGGQPVVQPNGTVIVPIANASETSILAFKSTNGGASWSSTVTVDSIFEHTVAGNLRSDALPSAEIDGAGKVYVVWQDCGFRSSCATNDIVMTTSTDGTTWTSTVRIPIDSLTSGRDHFIPGLAVDKSTSGSSAHLGLTYYYYPVGNCSTSTCQLDVGFVSSTNGGSTWSAATQLAGPMTLTWLASTTQGYMVGDYISTSFSGGKAYPVVAVASAPSGGQLNENMYSITGGLASAAGTLAVDVSSTHRAPPGGGAAHASPHAAFNHR